MGQSCANSISNQGFHSLTNRKSHYKGPFVVKENETYILKELLVYDSILFPKITEIFEQILEKNLKSPFILKIHEYWLEDKELYCQNSCHIAILLEKYKRDLESEIQIRQKTNRFFTEDEILGIIYAIMKALEYLISLNNNYFHGFLNLSTVVLGQNGQVKIMEGRILNPSNYGTIKEDLENLAIVIMKIVNLDASWEKNDWKKPLKNESFREIIEELMKGDKALKEYFKILKKIKTKNKKPFENKENCFMSVEENYMSFGDKSNFFISENHQVNEKPEINKILKENLIFFAQRNEKCSKKLKKHESNPDKTISLSSVQEITTKKQKVIYEDGSYYEGEIKNDLRHGKGTFVFSKGGFYKGEWQNGKMEGFGILYYSSGKVAYEGEWLDDAFEGRGTIFNEITGDLEGEQVNYEDFNAVENDKLWNSYSGEFKMYQKNGVGTLRFRTGEKLIGSFKNDKIDGNCAFYKKDGSVLQGVWADDKLVEEIGD